MYLHPTQTEVSSPSTKSTKLQYVFLRLTSLILPWDKGIAEKRSTWHHSRSFIPGEAEFYRFQSSLWSVLSWQWKQGDQRTQLEWEWRLEPRVEAWMSPVHPYCCVFRVSEVHIRLGTPNNTYWIKLHNKTVSCAVDHVVKTVRPISSSSSQGKHAEISEDCEYEISSRENCDINLQPK